MSEPKAKAVRWWDIRAHELYWSSVAVSSINVHTSAHKRGNLLLSTIVTRYAQCRCKLMYYLLSGRSSGSSSGLLERERCGVSLSGGGLSAPATSYRNSHTWCNYNTYFKT